MKYNQLGKSDLFISEVSFGCMSLGKDVDYNSNLLHQALDRGINYFDTADLYDHGDNESMVGKIFKKVRDKVIIATKVGNQWKKDGSGWDWNPSKTYILKAVEESLNRLETDYIDLYQLHGGTIDDPIDEIIEAFELLKQQGKIRFYGISSIRPNVIREYVKRSNIVSVMIQYGLLDQRPDEEALPMLEKNNIGVLARGSLAKGLLIDKTPSRFLEYTEEEVEKAAQCIHKMAGNERTVTAIAIQFALHPIVITSAVVGIRTQHQLEEALKSQFSTPLTDDEVNELKRCVKKIHYQQHR